MKNQELLTSPDHREVVSELETSIACSNPSQAIAHREFVLGKHVDDLRVQKSWQQLFAFAASCPDTALNLIGRSLRPGITHAGAGFCTIVYREDEEVVKVYKDSVYQLDDQRESFARQEAAGHEVLLQYVGSMALEQKTLICPHPLSPKETAIQIRQKYVSFTPLDDVFPFTSPSIDRVALGKILDESPHLADSLYDFATCGLRMRDETTAKDGSGGLVPDIRGRGNIGLTPDENGLATLILIDSQPNTACAWGSEKFIIPQLEDLLNYLELARAA